MKEPERNFNVMRTQNLIFFQPEAVEMRELFRYTAAILVGWRTAHGANQKRLNLRTCMMGSCALSVIAEK